MFIYFLEGFFHPREKIKYPMQALKYRANQCPKKSKNKNMSLAFLSPKCKILAESKLCDSFGSCKNPSVPTRKGFQESIAGFSNAVAKAGGNPGVIK